MGFKYKSAIREAVGQFLFSFAAEQTARANQVMSIRWGLCLYHYLASFAFSTILN